MHSSERKKVGDFDGKFVQERQKNTARLFYPLFFYTNNLHPTRPFASHDLCVLLFAFCKKLRLTTVLNHSIVYNSWELCRSRIDLLLKSIVAVHSHFLLYNDEHCCAEKTWTSLSS